MSTEDGSNKNNIDGNGTDKNSIDKEKTQEFLHKNGRYLIMAGMLVVILIGIVMLVNNKGTSSADPKARAEKVLKEDYQVDENEAVTKLMKNYYKYYAEGNVDKMKEIATPISKLEQSYIKMFSERVEKYKNIKCYTKEGLDKDSYIVSVTMDMKFPKIKTTIPSLETFYVRTDDKGNLYIDNLYSTFNYIATNEKDVDSSVSEFIDKYEEQDDFVKLANDIEKKSSKAIKSDKDLEKYVNKLNDKVIPKWLNNYKKAQEEEQKKKEEEQKKKDEEKPKPQAKPQEQKQDQKQKTSGKDTKDSENKGAEDKDAIASALNQARRKATSRTGSDSGGGSSVEQALAQARKNAGGNRGGGGGEGSGPGGGGLHSVYLGQVMLAVRPNWGYASGSRANLQCTVHITVTAAGQVQTAQIVASSGNAQYDASCVNAIWRTSKAGDFPPPPTPMYHELDIVFTLNEMRGR